MGLRHGNLVPGPEPEVTGIRSLARADLSLLLEKRPQKTLQSLSDGHHAVARAVAAGLPNVEIARLTGRNASRISLLKSDPAFQELVAHYRGIVTAEFVRSIDHYMEVATSNMLRAENMIADKLDRFEAEGELPPMRDLIAVSRDAADRFGYGKMQKNLNVNVDFAAQLEAARKRSSRAREVGSTAQSAPVIDHAPASHSPGPPLRRL